MNVSAGQTPKALLLLSGGLDSSTLLARLVADRGAGGVVALAVSYGQTHNRELDAARAVAAHYGVALETLDLTPVFARSNSALLAHSDQAIPREAYETGHDSADAGAPATYVPFRNGLFLAAAASVAQALDCADLYYAAHHDDVVGAVYPDCSEEFVAAMAQAVALGTGGDVHLHAPFAAWSKAEIVALGLKLAVPYELTWSCYEGGDVPCGQCGTCIDRRRAFEANGARDPLMASSVSGN